MSKQHEVIESYLEMFVSLNIAVQKAGGCVFSVKDLKEMSALELLMTLAPNDVRFCYTLVKEED